MSRHRPPHLAAALAALLSLSTLACEERAVLPEGTSCLRGLGEGIGGSAGTGSFKDCGPGMECRWEDTTCYRWREEGEACGPGMASNGKTALCGNPLRCVVDRPATCEGAACAGVCEKPFEAGQVCSSSNDCAEGRCVFGADGVGRCYVGRQIGSPCNADPFVGDAPAPDPQIAGQCAGELVCQPPSLGVQGVACDPETEPGCRLLGICDLPHGEGAGAGCFSDEACPRGLVCRTPVDPPLRYDPASGAYEAIHVPFRGGTCTPPDLPTRGENCAGAADVGGCAIGLECMYVFYDNWDYWECTPPLGLELGARCSNRSTLHPRNDGAFCAEGLVCAWGKDENGEPTDEGRCALP